MGDRSTLATPNSARLKQRTNRVVPLIYIHCSKMQVGKEECDVTLTIVEHFAPERNARAACSQQLGSPCEHNCNWQEGKGPVSFFS